MDINSSHLFTIGSGALGRFPQHRWHRQAYAHVGHGAKEIVLQLTSAEHDTYIGLQKKADLSSVLMEVYRKYHEDS